MQDCMGFSSRTTSISVELNDLGTRRRNEVERSTRQFNKYFATFIAEPRKLLPRTKLIKANRGKQNARSSRNLWITTWRDCLRSREQKKDWRRQTCSRLVGP